jgi:uncharacterized protein YjbJ (UPF0337 family)
LKEANMDKEHIKGAAEKAKGALKEAVGRMRGDKKTQVEGMFDKAKGEAREALGDARTPRGAPARSGSAPRPRACRPRTAQKSWRAAQPREGFPPALAGLFL